MLLLQLPWTVPACLPACLPTTGGPDRRYVSTDQKYDCENKWSGRILTPVFELDASEKNERGLDQIDSNFIY
ncbi:hypothetical protein SYJ56_13960 [Algoriphagus sp. D3-2-R+10]|uniref:hypothetical protein n=1 Tax=Algoriphagus aurantiacus TaxID=3103948 RepID=UPI002B391881|nr:hypothetical protein [Algoriphagus sp. D3-2-R+10]MEB2776423.1 hypothetical protein [Algoriphagus sp. D3-2-R+10]